MLQFVLISMLEKYESQEHCLHDWSQVVTVCWQKMKNVLTIPNTYVRGKIQNQKYLGLGVECVLRNCQQLFRSLFEHLR